MVCVASTAWHEAAAARVPSDGHVSGGAAVARARGELGRAPNGHDMVQKFNSGNWLMCELFELEKLLKKHEQVRILPNEPEV